MGIFLKRGPAPKKAPTTVEITLTGALDSTYGFVTVDGQKYATVQTITVPIGSAVTVTVGTSVSSSSNTAVKITLDGTVVATGSSSNKIVTYTFAANTSAICNFKENSMMFFKYYTCDITTS